MHRSIMVCFLLVACATNPYTGSQQLSLIPESQEIVMGKQAAQEVQASMGLVENPPLQRFVSELGKKLADETERQALPWSFRVVDDPTPNAFALPGGFIFITRGLLTHMNNEAELAMVMGHEIGHVTARHSVNMLSKQVLAQIGLGVGMILVPEIAQFGQVAGAGLQLLFLKFGRDAERQADMLGFRYALDDQYDVRAGAEVFETLSKLSAASGSETGKVPEWLQTHPNPENRLASLRKEADKQRVDPTKLRQNREQFIARLDDVVYGANPRQGFFEGNVFYHPDLQFQIAFPAGWKTSNQPQAVVAVPPGQDAAIMLGQAPPGTAEQAAQAFASQQGLRISAFPGPCNGICQAFQAQTQQGVLQGYTAFVSHQGKIFQILAFAPAQRFGAYEGTLRVAMTGLTQLTDPARLAVQPAKLDIVTLPAPITIEEFEAKYPSTIPLNELVLLNGVKPGEALTAGQKVKRVVGGTRKTS